MVKEMPTRKANKSELDLVYMMGFDVWGDGSAQAEYLTECRDSEKYKKRLWCVYEKNHKPVSSLIVYERYFDLPEQCIGIGSVATCVEKRKNGYASTLYKRHTCNLQATA